MPSKSSLMVVSLLLISVILPGPLHAELENQGAAIVTVQGIQTAQAAAPDGAGGLIVAWADQRTGTMEEFNIHAQHLLPSGELDPAWPTGGRAITRVNYANRSPSIIEDGSGGAYIAWTGSNGGAAAVFVWIQHLLSSGAIDPRWPTNGQPIGSYPAYQQAPPRLATDGAGGVVIAWSSWDHAGDIVAHRVHPNGAAASGWPMTVCADAQMQISPAIVSDGAGGVLVAWQDARAGGPYLQHLLASGEVAPGWPTNGSGFGSQIGTGYSPALLSDGSGGAIMSWIRSGGASLEIAAQRVSAAGQVDPAWPSEGRVLAATSSQAQPRPVTDGMGGAIVVWQDNRAGNTDIFAQRVRADGTIDPDWDGNGLVVCDDPYDQLVPSVDSDGSGGAIVAWQDLRSGASDIYAQHILSNGTLDSVWPEAGRAVCTERSYQAASVVTWDSNQGAYVCWLDDRRGDSDIYAQHLGPSGDLLLPDSDRPHLNAARDVPGDQGGRVSLRWRCTLDGPGNTLITGYRVWRRIPESSLTFASSMAGGDLKSSDDKRVRFDVAGLPTYWEAIATLPAEQLVHYGYTAETTQDSLPGGNPYTAFFVTALTVEPFVFYESNVDSGYSVDNLAPPAPTPFVAHYESNGASLHWVQSRGPDISFYRLHRGVSASFAPSAENLVVASPDTGYFDATGGMQFFYKLAAVDIHGNASRYSVVSPNSPTAALATLVSSGLESGTVSLRWYVSFEEAATITVYRRGLSSSWEAIGTVIPDGAGYASFQDVNLLAGARYGYRLGIRPQGGAEAFAGEGWVDIPLDAAALAVRVPNPVVSGSIDVSFTAPAGPPVRVELFDAAGRLVASQEVAGGLGRRTVGLARAAELAPGLYLVRVGLERPVVARVAVLR